MSFNIEVALRIQVEAEAHKQGISTSQWLVNLIHKELGLEAPVNRVAHARAIDREKRNQSWLKRKKRRT
jgi:hypothetical protein